MCWKTMLQNNDSLMTTIIISSQYSPVEDMNNMFSRGILWKMHWSHSHWSVVLVFIFFFFLALPLKVAFMLLHNHFENIHLLAITFFLLLNKNKRVFQLWPAVRGWEGGCNNKTPLLTLAQEDGLAWRHFGHRLLMFSDSYCGDVI